jgi:hypothetical protein
LNGTDYARKLCCPVRAVLAIDTFFGDKVVLGVEALFPTLKTSRMAWVERESKFIRGSISSSTYLMFFSVVICSRI